MFMRIVILGGWNVRTTKLEARVRVVPWKIEVLYFIKEVYEICMQNGVGELRLVISDLED